MRSFDYEPQRQRLSAQDDNRLQLKLRFSARDDYELQRSLSTHHRTIGSSAIHGCAKRTQLAGLKPGTHTSGKDVREKGVDNLWEQTLDGGTYRQLTHFTKDRILRVAYSQDGTKIAIERGESESDAVLLHDVGM